MRIFRHSLSLRRPYARELAQADGITTYPLPHKQLGVELGTGKDGRYAAILSVEEATKLIEQLNSIIAYLAAKPDVSC